MPNFDRYYAGDYLKMFENIQPNDNIKFLDEGKNVGTEEDPKIEFLVMVMRDGDAVLQKKFTLNKTNHAAIKAIYGSNTDGWVNKEMQVITSKVRNPKTGGLVDGIILIPPGTNEEGESL